MQDRVAGGSGEGASAVCGLTGISSQQKLGDDIRRLEEVLGGLPDDTAKIQLFVELKQIKESLANPGFLQQIADSYRKPLHDVSERLLLPRIKKALEAQEPAHMNEEFERNLKDCLNALMSATNYYIKLLFKSFYNNSKIRVLFGSACTIIELQVAYSALCYILNNATFVLSASFVPNLSALSATFTTAYNAMTKDTVIAFLKSYGYNDVQAAAIYATIAAVSAEQGKFILKGIFLKGVERFENKENPPAAAAAAGGAAAQPPPPSFLQFITDPSSLFRKVADAVPLPKLHLMIGEPGAAVSAVAVNKFKRFVGVVEDTVLRQLINAFPDDAETILVDILFNLLLGLDDADYDDTDKFDIKFSFFIQKLKDCLRAKYRRMTDEQFLTLCGENLPGLNRGLTEDIISRIYGPRKEVPDSQEALASNSQKENPGDPSFKTKVLTVFKTATLGVWEHFTCFLGAITPEQVAPHRSIKVSELEHPILELNKYIEGLKRNTPEFGDKFDRCFESFKRTIHIRTTTQGNVYVTTEISTPQRPNFGRACTDLYETLKEIGATVKGLNDKVATFFEMCFTVGYIVCNVSSDLVLPIPFGGNSVGASTAMAERYMDMIIDAQEKMIRQQQAAAAGEEVEPDGNASSAGGGDLMGQGDSSAGGGDLMDKGKNGGKSRSKSRKNTKRTRRNKGRKSSKAAKKTQQRRSSRYRRSSRKGRK